MERLVVITCLDGNMVVTLFQPSSKSPLGWIFSLSEGKVGTTQGVIGRGPSLIPAGTHSVQEHGNQWHPSVPCWVGMRVAKGPSHAMQTRDSLELWSSPSKVLPRVGMDETPAAVQS